MNSRHQIYSLTELGKKVVGDSDIGQLMLVISIPSTFEEILAAFQEINEFQNASAEVIIQHNFIANNLENYLIDCLHQSLIVLSG